LNHLLAVRPLLPDAETLGDMGLRLAVTWGAVVVLDRLVAWLTTYIERLVVRTGGGGTEAAQRARTLGMITRRGARTLLILGALIRTLVIFGWDVRPLLAGAGLLGVALGFGAQWLVRDVISGIFILIEDQFAVGDLIEVQGRAATVESITLRSTTLRDFNGFVHFVPNGEMKIVVNRSRGWNRIAVDVPIAADQDLDRALEEVNRIVRAMNEEPAWRERLLDPIETWGIETLGANEAQIRLVLRAHPGPDGPEAARELRRRVHAALVRSRIRTAPQRDIAITPLQPAEAPGQPPAPVAR
jgi:moderate conductance mechanosensitive channel